jgi:hypothetical protein
MVEPVNPPRQKLNVVADEGVDDGLVPAKLGLESGENGAIHQGVSALVILRHQTPPASKQ